jgi:uracil-DNA glycosylase
MKNPFEIYDIDGTWLEPREADTWALWQNSLKANILLIGQEWGDLKGFKQSHGKSSISSETNRNLIKLFKQIGVDVASPESGIKNNTLFFTNAALCLKIVDENTKGNKGAQGKTNPIWYHNCEPLIIRLIQIIEPRIIIPIGTEAYNSLAEIFHLPIHKSGKFSKIIDKTPHGFNVIVNGYEAKIFPVYHPSRRVINMAKYGMGRSWDDMLADWGRIKSLLATL